MNRYQPGEQKDSATGIVQPIIADTRYGTFIVFPTVEGRDATLAALNAPPRKRGKPSPPVIRSVSSYVCSTGHYAVVRTDTGKHEYLLPPGQSAIGGLQVRAAETRKLADDWAKAAALLDAAVVWARATTKGEQS